MNRRRSRLRGRSLRAAREVVVLAGAVLLTVVTAVAASADTHAEPPQDLNTVINNITRWLVGLLVALATLFLTVGGIRYLLAGGDPGEVGKAKDTLKYAAIGYGIAVMAPVLVNILKGFVGG
ncbi:pilin [Actinomadura sp. SCN-SB]|uniref:pilin n=1 Tax=Actinomadura sp. SCN-SB TaxID=3373092 RepID=UPI003753D389